ncbi:ACT domain-containing protein [Euzebya tangerina]|uniref:ACT domain-containing protein n=1 Tax=Euzebya tangerina TaxID=591198 RepID=UPI000E3202F8|nr:ACT domain-containing protein [Euzebya tangerina]
MPGESDLGQILTSLQVRRRVGLYVYATVPVGQPLPDLPIMAMVSEIEGTSIVVKHEEAVTAGLAYEYESVWLSLTTHTSLNAVGVTATIATAFAMSDIPCNVIAGYHHDHILVPADRVEDALGAVELVRANAVSSTT